MRSRTGIAACAAAAVWLFGLVRFASAEPVIFDSLGGANSGAANTSIDPVISGTFKTGASPLRVDVALVLSADIFEGGEGDSYTISLDGGIPLSDLSFDPMNGLDTLDGKRNAAIEAHRVGVALVLIRKSDGKRERHVDTKRRGPRIEGPGYNGVDACIRCA